MRSIGPFDIQFIVDSGIEKMKEYLTDFDKLKNVLKAEW